MKLKIALFALFALLLAGCQTNSTVTTASTPTTHPHAGKSSSAPESHRAGVRDTIVLKGDTGGEKDAITLVKVVQDAHPAPGGFGINNAPHGDRLFAAQFRIKAIGSSYSDSPSNGAVAIDNQGQQYQPGFETVSEGTTFGGSVSIPKGESALGYIVFEVAKHAKITKVQFSVDSGFGATGEWSF